MRRPLLLAAVLGIAILLACWWSASARAIAHVPDAGRPDASGSLRAEMASPTAEPVSAAAGAEQRQEVATTRDGESGLHGIVVGPAGQPLGGVAVTLSASSVEGYALLDEHAHDRRELDRATTAADGSYRLRLAAGRVGTVAARCAGFVDAVHTGCLAGSRVDLRLLPGATLIGTVRNHDTGLVVPGTRITVRHRDPGGGARIVAALTTDLAGVYRSDGLPAGTSALRIEPEVLASPREIEVELQANATTVRDIELTAGIGIRGHVLDDVTGAGIGGAEVRAGALGKVVRTGPDGAFEITGFEPGSNVSLPVRATGYAGIDYPLRLPGSMPADTRTVVEIRLDKGHSVHGFVVDEHGAPLADVYVAAVAAEYSSVGSWFRADWRSCRSGVDGGFALGELCSDMPHSLLFVHPGFATAVHELPADEPQRASIDFGIVPLRPPASLAGRVVDEHGDPVPDHEVRLRGHNDDRWSRRRPPEDGDSARDAYVAERHCRTDDRGRFAFADMAAGDYSIGTGKFDSHEELVVRCTVGPAESVRGVELRLMRGMAIAGRVFVADGGTLPKCYASIDPEDGQATNADVEVGADGAFGAMGLAAGSYKLTVYPYASEADRAKGRSFGPAAIEHVIAGSNGVRCEVPVFGEVRGRVVDADQAPAGGVRVAAFAGDRSLASVLTAADGTFSLVVPQGAQVWVGALDAARSAGRVLERSFAAAGVEAMPGCAPLLLVLPRR